MGFRDHPAVGGTILALEQNPLHQPPATPNLFFILWGWGCIRVLLCELNERDPSVYSELLNQVKNKYWLPFESEIQTDIYGQYNKYIYIIIYEVDISIFFFLSGLKFVFMSIRNNRREERKKQLSEQETLAWGCGKAYLMALGSPYLFSIVEIFI